jgi:hypothetical protein
MADVPFSSDASPVGVDLVARARARRQTNGPSRPGRDKPGMWNSFPVLAGESDGRWEKVSGLFSRDLSG